MNLANSVGWGLYREKLKLQIEQRKNTVFFSQCQDSKEALSAEYIKGEGSGVYLALNLLELLVEALDQELLDRQVSENDEDA